MEQGSHTNFMKAGGRYSNLVAFQRSHPSSRNEEDEVVIGDGDVLRLIEAVNGEKIIL
jgi:hypothetical protein